MLRFFKTNFLNIYRFLLKERNVFFEQTFKNDSFFLLNERFYWTNEFTKRMNLMNELFTKRSFSEKTIKIDGKWTIILRTNEIIFLNDSKKAKRVHLYLSIQSPVYNLYLLLVSRLSLGVDIYKYSSVIDFKSENSQLNFTHSRPFTSSLLFFP